VRTVTLSTLLTRVELLERWKWDCAFGRDHKAIDPFMTRAAYLHGRVRTFHLCRHCGRWPEREWNPRAALVSDLSADMALRRRDAAE